MCRCLMWPGNSKQYASMLVSTNTCMYFKYNSDSYHIVNINLQLHASRVTIAAGNSAARDLFVYTKAVTYSRMYQ